MSVSNPIDRILGPAGGKVQINSDGSVSVANLADGLVGMAGGKLTASGSGTANTLPLWTGTSVLGNSLLSQSGDTIGQYRGTNPQAWQLFESRTDGSNGIWLEVVTQAGGPHLIRSNANGTGVNRQINIDPGAGNFVYLPIPNTGGGLRVGSAWGMVIRDVQSNGPSIYGGIDSGLCFNGGVLPTNQSGALTDNLLDLGNPPSNRFRTGYFGTNISSPTITCDTLTPKTTDMTLSAGHFIVNTVGKGLKIKEGSNAKMGTGTLSSGTATVSTTAVTASSRIFISDAGGGVLANIGALSVGTVMAGVSFVVNSANALDSSNFAWILIEPA